MMKRKENSRSYISWDNLFFWFIGIGLLGHRSRSEEHCRHHYSQYKTLHRLQHIHAGTKCGTQTEQREQRLESEQRNSNRNLRNAEFELSSPQRELSVLPARHTRGSGIISYYLIMSKKICTS